MLSMHKELHLPDAIGQIGSLYCDAGVGSIRLLALDPAGHPLGGKILSSNCNLQQSFQRFGLHTLAPTVPLFLTGKLQRVLYRFFGRGECIDSVAALWSAVRSLQGGERLALIELSASGYLVIGVAADGTLADDLLSVNPRCGAGSGVNMERILQKLAIAPEDVDSLLHAYLGGDGEGRRGEVEIRADRCGVFSASATISDKNQGLPLEMALAVTLKTEVLKACKQLTAAFATVWLTGGIFAWRFARDCACDYLATLGIKQVHYDPEGILPLQGLIALEERIGRGNFVQVDSRVLRPRPLAEYPAFAPLRLQLEGAQHFRRLTAPPLPPLPAAETLRHIPLIMALDVGSTMAKLVLADAQGAVLYQSAYSNAGDTIATIKAIFADLGERGGTALAIVQIGITGSARYQVQIALTQVYPVLADRVTVLVENYAHARGSLDYAQAEIARLEGLGIKEVNRDFCLLIDVGGEDTKISTIALGEEELFANAMNAKCSAGTGSLLDTLVALFALDGVAAASELALAAEKGYAINATCAVFLLENARKLQAEGVAIAEILASASWAIVENMARSLWRQIDLPKDCVTLLHGQTMLSDPLPLAIAQRIQEVTGSATYCLVPPDPGHRACIGLIRTLAASGLSSSVTIELQRFIDQGYQKRMIQCHGALCGDAQARCHRTHLTSSSGEDTPFSFLLGGCTAINEVRTEKGAQGGRAPDLYREVWQWIGAALPTSTEPQRLVIPRSFAVSEWASFFVGLFAPLGIPVHVDSVQEADILAAQPHFHIDTCAPHLGVVGQFLRLARLPHGVILAPQIEFLPVSGNSLGRTCTINQGGFAVAQRLAQGDVASASIHLFRLDLKGVGDPESIALKIYPRLLPVYRHYGLEPTYPDFLALVTAALAGQRELKARAADHAAQVGMAALDAGHPLALVLGREYILHPGVFDSHVGRLLRDQGLVGIPAYLLDVTFDPDFEHLYWRNPHSIASIVRAAAKRELHRVVQHPGLRALFARAESFAAPIPMIQVSTFLCGPDSVSNLLIAELSKNRPFLRLQSDGAIKELAHLENRVNTYVKQLQNGLHEKLLGGAREEFSVQIFDLLVNRETINAQSDVIYFPTLSDQRQLTAVIRGAGYTCIDLYHDDYALAETVKRGRQAAGDAVCAPLAAVYGDLLLAIDDFARRKATDPAFAGKKRLLMFNNKGLGPCRQGQYVEAHKLLLGQQQSAAQSAGGEEQVIRFLVGEENKGFNTGFPEWVFIRGVQAVILQGVLHQLLADGASRCRHYEEYAEFLTAYRQLKGELCQLLEEKIAPTATGKFFAKKLGAIPILGLGVKYFSYRFYAQILTPPLQRFARRWCQRPLTGDLVRIHIDGEAYMRVAQYEELQHSLLGLLGFGKFTLTHAPIWSFLDYKVAGMLMRCQESIRESQAELRHDLSFPRRQQIRRFLGKKRRRLLALHAVDFMQRQLLARPLYRAAGLAMPEAMPKVLDEARAVIATRRPGGELIPYIGETMLKLKKGFDLIINVAPEGCMVSSMGEVITPGIMQAVPEAKGKVFPLFSQQGDVDQEALAMALLKTLGPERFYAAGDKSL